eukprot:6213190-Pleurochrysis_carterae.AAC.3
MSWPVTKLKSALLPRKLLVLRRGRVERRVHPRHPLGARFPRVLNSTALPPFSPPRRSAAHPPSRS